MSEVLVLDHVSKTFVEDGSVCPAIEDISCSIHEKEIVCLMGPSGCGKSTVLRIICGLDTADSGTVLGRNGVDLNRLHTAMVFQEHGLFPWLSVTQNISYGLHMHVRSEPGEEVDKKVSKLLSLVHLDDFAHALPHQLSGGMKQRVAVARALAIEPDILLMDEPFSALDPFTRRELQDEVIRIREQLKSTFFIVTHNPEEAVYLSDRIIVLSERPATVLQDIPLSLSHPRNMTDPTIIGLVQEVTGLIGSMMHH